MVTIIFKNIIFHLSHVLNSGGFDFRFLQVFFGYDFLLILFFGSLALIYSGLYKKKQVFFYLIILFVYFIYGLSKIDLVSVAAYSRFYLTPLFAFSLGIFFSIYGHSKYVGYVVLAFLCYVLIECLPGFYELIQVNMYIDLKYYGRDINSYDYLHKMGMTINEIRFQRVLGPQMHPISAAYSILFLYAYLFCHAKKWFYLSTPIIFVLLFLTSKGALAAGLLMFSFSFIWNFCSSKRGLLTLVITMYSVTLVLISSIPGLTSGYEHMLGLIGGLSNLISNPIGSGIGFGGTMSSLKGVENGGESGFGVVVSHLGVFGVIIYLYVFKKLFLLMYSSKSSDIYIFSGYCIILLINGLLQEEALLPSASFLGWFLLAYSIGKYQIKTICWRKNCQNKI